MKKILTTKKNRPKMRKEIDSLLSFEHENVRIV